MSDLRNQIQALLDHYLCDVDDLGVQIGRAKLPGEIMAIVQPELDQYRQGNTRLQAINQQRHEDAQRANYRAEQAEATLARVRATAEQWRYVQDRKRAAEELLRALDGDGQ